MAERWRHRRETLPMIRRPAALHALLCLCTACGSAAATFDPPDVAADVVVDAVTTVDVHFDIAKHDTKLWGSDTHTGTDVKELCANLLDDNDDGRIDENCWPAPNLRADQTWTDLGVFQLPTTQDAAPVATFGAPLKNQGMLLIGREAGEVPSLYVWAETLTSPAGIAVLTQTNWAKSLNRASPAIGGATALVGMAPEVSLIAGPWSFSFTRSNDLPLAYKGSPAGGWLHYGVLARPEIAQPKAVTLDLDVYIAPGTALPAASLPTSPQWKQIQKKIETIWLAAHLKLGTVQFYDIDGDAGKQFKYLDNVMAGDATNELTLFYTYAGTQHPKSTAAILVLASGLDDHGVPVAAGLSQLAGAPGLAGSRLGGMAVAIDDSLWAQVLAAGPDSTAAADMWGVVIAHEMGHFLGLWHTDENDGSLHDPLGDTPECDKPDPQLTPDVCPIQAKYLMFWSPKGTTVTPSQVAVVRRHPALR